MAAKRILAVENEQDILDVYEYLFSGEGYEVRTSLTGDDIIGQIDAFHPDVILLDIDLGVLNGCDLCRVIKDNPATKPIIVILISGEASTHKLMRYCRADEFVAKPFDINNLLQLVADVQ